MKSQLSQRQQQIVEVSIRLIAEKGIQNLTIRNISTAIGVSEPALYRHFRNKSEIILALLDSFQKIACDVLGGLEGSGMSSLEKLHAFVMDRYRRCAENPELAKVMFSEEFFQSEPEYADKILAIMHSHKDAVQGIICAGQESGEINANLPPLHLFRIIFGALRLLIKQWCLSGFAFDLEQQGEQLWQTLVIMMTV
jgi:AcrR family transcriptional regulator